ncbi:hypothetical protein C8R43DRAFT_1194119 [Mycena crocata]|nr:hypothetical protein C8R43DRAFT_1194119 [Mycena crocata]
MNPSEAKNRSLFIGLDDLLLGSFGAKIGQPRRLDHAIRFFSTWSGTDKFMMACQYTAKLVAPFLLYRAQLQFRAGKRAKPLSLTHDGLYKFAGQLSQARRIGNFSGILYFFQVLSALERSPPTSRLALNIGRLQGLAMLVFYPLEYISFFSAPFSGPLLRISPTASMWAQLWSVRSWGVWVALRIVQLCSDWMGLVNTERRVIEEGDSHDVGLKQIRKRKRAILYGLLQHVSRLPVILHWSIIGGIYQNERKLGVSEKRLFPVAFVKIPPIFLRTLGV